NATAGMSATCAFSIDNSGPSAPPTVTSTVFQDCVADPNCSTAGAVGVDSPVTLGSNGASGVVAYRYWWDRTPTLTTTVNTSNGAAVTVLVTPTGLPNGSLNTLTQGGQMVLDVVSVDAAGNESTVGQLSTLVGTAPSAAGDWLMDDATTGTLANAVPGGLSL